MFMDNNQTSLPQQFHPCTLLRLISSKKLHEMFIFLSYSCPHWGKVDLSKGRIAREKGKRRQRVNHVTDQLQGTVKGSLLGVRCGPSVQS